MATGYVVENRGGQSCGEAQRVTASTARPRSLVTPCPMESSARTVRNIEPVRRIRLAAKSKTEISLDLHSYKKFIWKNIRVHLENCSSLSDRSEERRVGKECRSRWS